MHEHTNLKYFNILFLTSNNILMGIWQISLLHVQYFEWKENLYFDEFWFGHIYHWFNQWCWIDLNTDYMTSVQPVKYCNNSIGNWMGSVCATQLICLCVGMNGLAHTCDSSSNENQNKWKLKMIKDVAPLLKRLSMCNSPPEQSYFTALPLSPLECQMRKQNH